MRLAKCPHCGAGLDLTNVPAGAAVSCGGCGKPFWVAAGVAEAPPKAPAPGPARRPAAPPPPPPSRSKAPPPRKKPARASGKNPLPLLAGFGGLVAVVVLGLSWIAFGNKGGRKPAAPAAPEKSVAKAPPPAPETPKSPLEPQ